MEARSLIKTARLYAITSPSAGGKYLESVEAALEGGADIIQLRDKNLPSAELLPLAKTLKDLCHAHGALFIVNDHLDLALASGADGVHLGQNDLGVTEAKRSLSGQPLLIGCSSHSLGQALKAEADGADYVGCGPIFATPTKPDYEARGLELVRQYRAHVSIPFVAIGGIDAGNIAQVKEAGASCVALVRAIFDQPDISAAARSLKQKMS